MALTRELLEIDQFLGVAQIFASAIEDGIERELLAGKPVTGPQIKLLKLVAMTDSYTLGDVAAFLDVSNAAASKTVDRMVRCNLLRRTADATDRRTVHLVLTPCGRRLLESYEAARERKLQRVFAQFRRKDLKCAGEVLDRIAAEIVGKSAGANEVCVKCGIYFRERCQLRRLAKTNCFYERHAVEIERGKRKE
jgi:DNA-binding MarR family transcriptional regulator